MSTDPEDIEIAPGVKFEPFEHKPEEKPPVPSGGIIRNYCPKCGGPTVSSGNGLIRELCSECGEEYEEPRYA